MHDDNDSLFGSPPPSPERGRSPLLALPEDSGWRMENALVHTQNVGTIALPGSQNNFSKIPAQPAVPNACTGRPPFLKLTPASLESSGQIRQPPHRLRQTATPTSSSTKLRVSHPRHLAKKHSERMDRTLSDLVSLISHFSPVESTKLPLSVSSSSNVANQEGTKENPIQVDDTRGVPTPIDAVNNALIALASTVASALKLPSVPRDHPRLSEPAVHQVLQCIKHDPKLIPTLQATHEYLSSLPRHPPDEVPHSIDDTTPSKLKRKRKQYGPRIPAGAEHWNVPFPFAPGHAPAGYPTQWQLERGRGVLGQLLGLFERAFVQSRGKGFETTPRPPAKRPRTASSSLDGKSNDMQVDEVEDQMPSGLNSHRMTEWLSSISVLPAESIIEPTPMDAPFSDVSPANISLDDISNVINVCSLNSLETFRPPAMDFIELFGGFDWQSSGLSSGTETSVIPCTPIGMDLFPLADSLSGSFDSNAIPLIFSTALPQNSQSVALDSIEGIFTSIARPPQTSHLLETAQSTRTIPTASGSSSVREGTPLEPSSETRGLLSREKGSNVIQRKVNLLLEAHEYQNKLLQNLERVALKRWELQIEQGILQNLKRATTGSS